jgi:hypothetical protein
MGGGIVPRMRTGITLVAALAAAAAGQPQTATVNARLSAEMARTRTALEANAAADERAAPLARLDRAATALNAGRLLLATYLTEMPWESARNFEFVKASADITTQDAFVRKWTAMGEPRPVASPRGTRLPAFIDALASAAEGRGPATYHASRPYAEDSGLFGGLYYLADAHSVMQFAAMLRGVDWPTAAPPPSFRSLAIEIAALDTDMTAAYEKMERANHPTYISASAALKQARTLNDGGRFSGALFEYLLSRYLFAPLRGPAAAEATVERIAAARTALPATADHSIAEFFLQLADEALAGNSEAQRRAAAAVLDDVIPAYNAVLGAPATTAPALDAAQVTITLVRWPFT